jgi:hypothetical protein
MEQAVATSPSDAQGSLTATASPFSDYTLQTDHYVVALIPMDGAYYNPNYFSYGSCDDDSSDCSIGPEDGPLVVAVADIYLGSTAADQSAMPTSSSSFLQAGQLPAGIAKTTGMVLQIALLTTTAIKVIDEVTKIGNSVADPQIPVYVSLTPISGELARQNVGDVYEPDSYGVANGAQRERQYWVKDAYGHLWVGSNPLLRGERFEQVSFLGSLPTPDGQWASQASTYTFSGAQTIDPTSATMLDHYAFGGTFSVQFNQYYFASNFKLPPWWHYSAADTAKWPLIIVDRINTCIHGGNSATQFPPNFPIPLPGQTIYETSTGIGVDGDSGPAAPSPYFHGAAHTGSDTPYFP